MRLTALGVFGGTSLLVCGLALGTYPAAQNPPSNRSALILQDFQRRVAQYLKLQKKVQASLPPLKKTSSPSLLAQRQRLLAERMRAARRGAGPGAIFTPEITADFRRLIRMSMRGHDAARIRASLRQVSKVSPRISVNEVYPETAPLGSIPPSILLNLPKLPPELDYHLIGRELILRDVKSDLVVDLIRAAIP